MVGTKHRGGRLAGLFERLVLGLVMAVAVRVVERRLLKVVGRSVTEIP